MKKVALIILLLSVLMVTYGLIYIYQNKTSSNEKKVTQGFQLIGTKTVKICQKKCELESMKFSELALDTSIPVILEKINQINSDTKNYYELATSDINKIEECSAVRDKYKHQFYILTNYQLYQNDEIISIAVNRTKRNVCNSTYETIPYSIIVYDKENKIELTQQDILNKAGYTEETVNQAIINYIENNNKFSDYKINLDDIFIDGKANYSLFYNENGEIVLAFQIRSINTFNYQEISLGN